MTPVLYKLVVSATAFKEIFCLVFLALWIIWWLVLTTIHTAGRFGIATINVNAESVDGSSPGARVTWSTTIPHECVASLRVDFRAQSEFGTLVATYNTTNTSQTEVIQTGLQCTTNYFITVVFTGEILNSIRPTLSNSVFRVLIGGKNKELWANFMLN